MAFADLIDLIDRAARSLLGGELIVVDATLTKVTSGTRMPGAVSGGTNPTTSDYPCRGWVAKFDAGQIDGTTVRREDRKISLLAATLPAGIEPKPGDTITIGSETYRVIGGIDGVDRDPASFNFTCHGRK